MKTCIWLGLGLVIATASPAAERTFVLVPAGDVAEELVLHTQDYMEKNAGVAVRLGSPVAMEPGQSLEDIGRAAAGTLGGNDHSIIVLARPASDQPQGVCLPQERFAILNVARLEAVDPAGKLERRLGQESLRVMAMLLEMAPCPFPLCVLVGYEKTEDLDEMSGNFCPPCRERFLRKADEAGLRRAEPTAD